MNRFVGKLSRWQVLPLLGVLALFVLVACTKEVVKEVPVIEIVTQEVIREVPVEKIVTVEKEVIRMVEVEKPVDVVREVVREVQVRGETIVVEKEVVKVVEVPGETIVVEKVVKVPGETIVVTKEVVKEVRVVVTPVPGSQAVFGLWSSPKAMNPWVGIDGYSRVVQDALFLGLVTLDKGAAPVAAAAESWDVSDDGLTYTFYLRKDGRWSDGKPVTAHDVVFTLTLNAEKALTSNWYAQHKAIKGYEDYHEGLADTVAGLKVINDYTVEITLERRDVVFLYALDQPPRILPKHILGDVAPDQLATDPFWYGPVTNGPFKFVKWKPDQFVEFERFDDYVLGSPRFEKYFIRIGTQDVLTAQLEKGEVDLNRVAPTEYDRISDLPGIQLIPSVSGVEQLLMVNTTQPYLADKRVRQAFAYAIDRPPMLKTLFGDTAVLSMSSITPGTWAFNPNLNPYDYDPVKAKALLEEVGWDFDRELVFRYPSGNKPREFSAPIIQQFLKEIGVKSKLAIADFPTLIERWQADDYDLLLVGHGPKYDPSLTGGRFTCNAGNSNIVNYCNPRVDELLELAGAITDQAQRRVYFLEYQEILNDELPHIALYLQTEAYGVRDSIQGLDPSSLAEERGFYWNIQRWNVVQ